MPNIHLTFRDYSELEKTASQKLSQIIIVKKIYLHRPKKFDIQKNIMAFIVLICNLLWQNLYKYFTNQMQKTSSIIDLYFEGKPYFMEGAVKRHLKKEFELLKFEENPCENYKEEKLIISIPNHSTVEQWSSKLPVSAQHSFTRNLNVWLVINIPEHGVIMKSSISIYQIISGHEGKTKICLQDQDQTVKMEIFISWVGRVEKSDFELNMMWRATNLPTFGFGFFSTNSYRLRFLKANSDGTFIEATRTEIVKKNNQILWDEVTLRIGDIIDVKAHTPFFKVQCWRCEGKKKEDLIGEVRVDYSAMKGDRTQSIVFVMRERVSNEFRGNLVLQNKHTNPPPPSFLQLIQHGLTLTYTIAFTFTGGLCQKQKRNKQMMAQCIRNSWECMAPYINKCDGSKNISIFGIGQKREEQIQRRTIKISSDETNNNNTYKHYLIDYKFPTFNASNPSSFFLQKSAQISEFKFCQNLQKLKNLNEQEQQPYKYEIQLTPTIHQIIQQANNPLNSSSIHIVLILFDEEFKDIEQAYDLLVSWSNHPFVFMFLGFNVCEKVFEKMVKLKADYENLNLFNREMVHLLNCQNLQQIDGSWRTLLQLVPASVENYTQYIQNFAQPFNSSKDHSIQDAQTNQTRSS